MCHVKMVAESKINTIIKLVISEPLGDENNNYDVVAANTTSMYTYGPIFGLLVGGGMSRRTLEGRVAGSSWTRR